MGGNASPGKVNFTAGLYLFLFKKQQQRFVPLQDLQQSCCTNGKDQDNQNMINLRNMSSSLWKCKVQVDQGSAMLTQHGIQVHYQDIVILWLMSSLWLMFGFIQT